MAKGRRPLSRASILTIPVLFLLAAGPVAAFHDQGVAHCNGCHTMHNSADGGPLPGNDPAGNEHLLVQSNATDTCLTCHASAGTLAGGTGYGSGGDFYWLTRTFTWVAHGSDLTSTGDSHGHNVVSGDHGIGVDAVHAHAPGGTFASDDLGCTSCHDPHGNLSFRMLWGPGPGPFQDGVRFPFASAAPLAAPGSSYRTLAGSDGAETDSRHTVYKSGMSDWCANCHPDMHAANSTDFLHPTGAALGSGIAGVYNAYVSTVDPVSGVPQTSYLALVPFEAVQIDLGAVDPTNHTAGPVSGDQVMCLTCHRAHASAFPDAGRWDFAATLLARDSHPRNGDGGASADDVANSYYGRTFPSAQRSLCNKCHVKDFGDVPDGIDEPDVPDVPGYKTGYDVEDPVPPGTGS
ncbi:MAG: hypothetical protein ABIK96_02410 [bacterium]